MATHQPKRFGYIACGYTLIEILIVLFIISIVSSVALVSIKFNENRQLATFADEFTQVVALAEEHAMLQPAVLGLTLNDNDFQFTRYQPAEGNKKSSWTPLTDNVLGKQHLIPANIQLALEVGHVHTNLTNEADANPQIILSTNGDITPFTIYVGKKGGKPRYAITGDADGNVTNTLLES